MANEKRLIDANELCFSKFPKAGMSDYKNGWNDALDAATTQAPTVDAVDVVRCKDCKHWNEETGWCDEHSHFFNDGMDWDVFNDDDFCSCGERKDKNENQSKT